MKFSCSTDINVPIDKAVALFNDPANFKEWQDGFVSYETVSGTPRSLGSQARVIYRNGKHRIELLETIKVMNLPAEMTALYEHKHMVNDMTTRFAALPGNKTRYTAEIGYSKFIGLMPKLMALFMPGVFKKQTQKWVNQFKAFAERN